MLFAVLLLYVYYLPSAAARAATATDTDYVVHNDKLKAIGTKSNAHGLFNRRETLQRKIGVIGLTTMVDGDTHVTVGQDLLNRRNISNHVRTNMIYPIRTQHIQTETHTYKTLDSPALLPLALQSSSIVSSAYIPHIPTSSVTALVSGSSLSTAIPSITTSSSYSKTIMTRSSSTRPGAKMSPTYLIPTSTESISSTITATRAIVKIPTVADVSTTLNPNINVYVVRKKKAITQMMTERARRASTIMPTTTNSTLPLNVTSNTGMGIFIIFILFNSICMFSHGDYNVFLS